MKKVIAVLALLVLLAATVPADVAAYKPGWNRAGTIRRGQVAVVRRGAEKVKITVRPLLGPRVRVTYRKYRKYWIHGLPIWLFLGKRSKTFWYTGQLTGIYVTPYIWVQCLPRSCSVGTVALYLRGGWTRRR